MENLQKLKQAAEEIIAILKKHDIAGFVVLHTPGYSEYLNHIEPTYSCLKLSGGKAKFLAKKEHYENSEKIRDYKVTSTSNMLHCMSTLIGPFALNYYSLSKQIDKITDAEHNGNGHSTQEEQNN